MCIFMQYNYHYHLWWIITDVWYDFIDVIDSDHNNASFGMFYILTSLEISIEIVIKIVCPHVKSKNVSWPS